MNECLEKLKQILKWLSPESRVLIQKQIDEAYRKEVLKVVPGGKTDKKRNPNEPETPA